VSVFILRKAKVLSILDLDVPPSVAVGEAGLGTMEEVVGCVKNADVLKPAHEAAEELLQVMSGDSSEEGYGNTYSLSLFYTLIHSSLSLSYCTV
jgi:hypothetical protein